MTRQRKRSRTNCGLFHLSDVADQVFETIGSKKTRQRLKAAIELTQHWEEIVGAIAAKNVRLLGLRPDGTLVVEASTAAWMQEIRCLERQILAKVHAYSAGRHARRLRVSPMRRKQYGAQSTSSAQRESKPDYTITDSDLTRIEQVLATVGDPELKKTLKRLFEHTLRNATTISTERNAP